MSSTCSKCGATSDGLEIGVENCRSRVPKEEHNFINSRTGFKIIYILLNNPSTYIFNFICIVLNLFSHLAVL
jgi:hypothetical protein